MGPSWERKDPDRTCAFTEHHQDHHVLDREGLAREARDSAGVSEFRVTGSLRSAWYEAQRKDESLAGHFKKPSHPFVIAGDGILEREVQLKTGQVVQVPVVPNGVAAANGITWRKSCYLAVHAGVLGAHRSAQVTFKLMERCVWWPSMEEDIRRWVESCLSCLKGRSRPTRVEAKAVRCTASTCWEEVSIDCEGPNKEDRDGFRYSMTYLCCLSHAVMLEPMKSLTHAEVRKAFTRCVLRSRTLPALIRTDRGVEFRNALMKEMTALLGAQQRFSMALRPCEMGSNERMHQEVQKTLGALVRELGAAANWSEWLLVAEYILDNSPGPHGYTPRDLERSWSLALPLEKDVLRDCLQFEPISDWAKRQFGQFAEISKVVAKHWQRASEARAKLANRFRRTVDLKVGDRVVWKSPAARPEGAGRVPWKPGLNGPWEVVEVKGNRLWLELVERPPPGAPAQPRRRQEAHAEDCILVPADSSSESRDPIVFEEDRDEAPSLGQQITGEGKQVEFTLHRRGREFVLRLGEKVAYKRAHHPKICFLGKVTQVDSAQAQVSVHRYIPDASGLRVKWRLAYLDEEGQIGSEGSRPSLEPVSIKEIICKVDLSKDGALAAGSARKLDKGGYSLKETVVEGRVALAFPTLVDQCKELILAQAPSLQGMPGVWQSAEGQLVARWLNDHSPARVQFWELFAGQAGLTEAARANGLATAPPIDKRYPSFGRSWDLACVVDQELFWSLYGVLNPEAVHVGLPCEHGSTVGAEGRKNRGEQSLRSLTIRLMRAQEDRQAKGTAEHPLGSRLWSEEDWVGTFGPLSEPLYPWQYVATDGCQFGMESQSSSDKSFGQPVKKGQVWLSNYCLSEFSLRCGQPDALFKLEHSHCQNRGSVSGVKWMGCSKLSGSYEPACCQLYARTLVRALSKTQVSQACSSLPPVDERTQRDSAPRRVLTLSEAVDARGVSTTEEMSQSDRARLEQEIQELSSKMDELWRVRADRREWDEVKADLKVYQYSGHEVTVDPRRCPEYRRKVVDELGFGADFRTKRPNMTEADVAACREVVSRKAGGFWLEDSPRTTVRNVLHDCVPTGPPVSSQPHNLKGEAASWVDSKLEEEVQRGQLVRGSSAWGSPPFPTREAPAHKKARKRRLVVDYRRVNARVLRSTYYCRKASDVLAQCSGSIWYSFVDAVTGFNQIANTRRAMEVLAIVARSGKFLPVCLTFGPVNGPDDFCFVVDRAYAPGRNRKMRYTKEWVAYVDDLTVRTGRVLDGRFMTDEEAEREILEACKNAPVEAVQPAVEALEALGVSTKGSGEKVSIPKKHDERESDHNHPTRCRVPPRVGSVLLLVGHVGTYALPQLLVKEEAPQDEAIPQRSQQDLSEGGPASAASTGRNLSAEELPADRKVAVDQAPETKAAEEGAPDQGVASEAGPSSNVKDSTSEKKGEPSPEEKVGRAASSLAAPSKAKPKAKAKRNPKGAAKAKVVARSSALRGSQAAKVAPKTAADRAYKVWGRALKLNVEVIVAAEAWAKANPCSRWALESPFQVRGLAVKQIVAQRKLKGSISAEEAKRLLQLEQECSSCDERRLGQKAGVAEFVKRRARLGLLGPTVGPGGKVIAKSRNLGILQSANLRKRKKDSGRSASSGSKRDRAVGESTPDRSEKVSEKVPEGAKKRTRLGEYSIGASGRLRKKVWRPHAPKSDSEAEGDPAPKKMKLGRMARGESVSRAAKRIRLQSVARWDPVVLVDAKPGQSSDPTRTRPVSPERPPKDVPLLKVRPVHYEYGSWVCSDYHCRKVNGPAVYECEDCGSSYWDSVEWASDFRSEVRRTERGLKKHHRETLVSQALDAGRWICARCKAENLMSRKKCYKCSTPKPPKAAAKSSSSSDDPAREERIDRTLDDLHAVHRVSAHRKRGGRKHNRKGRKKRSKKKVCRRGRIRDRRPLRKPSRGCLSTPRKVLNKLQHALVGNTVGISVKTVLFASLLPLLWKTEQEAEVLVETVTHMAVRVVEELEESTAGVVYSAGVLVRYTLLVIAMIIVWWIGWWVSRIAANKLARSYHGNTMPAKLIEMKPQGSTSEITWEVAGTKGVHRVWLSISDGSIHQKACACKAFIVEGTCGHIDAAVEAAKGLELVNRKGVTFESGLSSTARRRGVAALGSSSSAALSLNPNPTCFDGMMGKAQRMFMPNVKETEAAETGCFPSRQRKNKNTKSGGTASEQEGGALLALPAPSSGAVSSLGLDRTVGTVQDVGKSTTCQVQYLKDDAPFPIFVGLCEELGSGSSVYLRAYSCDQPDVVDALLSIVGRGVKVSVIMDQTQSSGKTKNQLQVAKQLQVSGVKVHMTKGKSVSAAYQADRRKVKVGSGLQGLHHAKSALICSGRVNHMIVTSCNWTTSSRSNREVGVLISTSETSGLVADWLMSWQECLEASVSIGEVEDSLQRNRAGRSSTSDQAQ